MRVKDKVGGSRSRSVGGWRNPGPGPLNVVRCMAKPRGIRKFAEISAST